MSKLFSKEARKLSVTVFSCNKKVMLKMMMANIMTTKLVMIMIKMNMMRIIDDDIFMG